MFDTDGNERVDKNEFLVVSSSAILRLMSSKLLAYQVQYYVKFFSKTFLPIIVAYCSILRTNTQNKGVTGTVQGE